MSGPDGLGYEDDLAVAWEAHPVKGEEALQRVNAEAARLMKAMAAMEEFSRDTSEEVSHLHQELHRLEGKLDLVLSIVANLSGQRLALPPSALVTVRASGLQWSQKPDDLALDSGAVGVVAVYLYPGIPLPVRLPAKVVDYGDGTSGVMFTDLVAEVRNALERHVFRHHRRAVARAAVARGHA